MCLRSLSLVLVAASLALPAQTPHYGFGLSLMIPAGGFRRTTYPAGATVTVPQTERYDAGIGGQFTVSFPVDPHVALRLNFSGHTADGTNTAPGYDRINLQHRMLSLGGDLQVFPGEGSALRHRGTYLLGGLSADFEHFDRSFGTPNWDETDSTRKTRLGGTFGLGHSFGYDGFGHFTLECAYHATLTGHDTGAGDPPPTDFAKVSFGWVF